MDFGDILNDWERLSARPGGLSKAEEAEKTAKEAQAKALAERRREEARRRRERAARGLETWLEENPVPDKDAEPEAVDERRLREAERERLRELKPQARLDLHGKTAAEAEAALALFLNECVVRGLEKVLVVTGKGNHSAGEPVLGKAARRVLESSPLAGSFGQAEKSLGGSGALWVVLRKGLISRGR